MDQIVNMLGELSNDQLAEVVDAVKAERARRREIAKANAESEKAERAEFAQRQVSQGDTVRFLFGKSEATGEVLSVNKSSFTIQFDLNGETVKRYIKPHRILDMAETEVEEEVEV